ncbi:hemolysin family protein [Nocardia zapadnayensis]|nr:hemolysin family protein [Nocardia zapadnayensis]MCX0278435.1 hemolysin family protein [Nocardia zapadnayensis]
MTAAWLVLLAVVVLILANALFVAVEFAYLTVNKTEVRRAASDGDRTMQAVSDSLTKTSSNLSGAQLGITVTSLVVGFLTGPSLGVLLTEGLGWAGLAPAAATGIATTAAFIIATFSQMVFGELVPKNWAIAEPALVSRLVVYPQKVFMTVFGWLVWVLNSAANVVLRLLGFTPEEEVASARTAQELRAVVSQSGRQGTLDRTTAELAARSIEFGQRTAADVMQPRPQVTFLEDESAQDLLDLVADTGHSRFPVIGETVDEVVGVVHFKHALAVPFEERASTPVRDIAVEAPHVVESMTLDPLLAQLREPGLQIAIVADEYGGTAGIVTLEDLLEEIVGEIDDEQDSGEDKHRRLPDGGLAVSGLLRPDELGEIMRLRLPEGEESDTLGGLIAERLNQMPEAGDRIEVDGADLAVTDEDDLPTPARIALTVGAMDGQRVDEVVVHRLTVPGDDDDDDDSDDADGGSDDRTGAEEPADRAADRTGSTAAEGDRP